MTDDRKLRDAKGISMPALVKAAIAFRHALRQHSGAPDADVQAMRAALRALREPDEAMRRQWRIRLEVGVGMPRGIAEQAVQSTVKQWTMGIDQILATGEGR